MPQKSAVATPRHTDRYKQEIGRSSLSTTCPKLVVVLGRFRGSSLQAVSIERLRQGRSTLHTSWSTPHSAGANRGQCLKKKHHIWPTTDHGVEAVAPGPILRRRRRLTARLAVYQAA